MTLSEKFKLIRKDITMVGLPRFVNEIFSKVNPYDKVVKKQERLYEITVSKDTELDYEQAETFYHNTFYGACTSCRSGNFYMRNLDWFYNYDAELVIITEGNENRFASVGIADSKDSITDESMEKTTFNDSFRAAACSIVDGINEKGVCASINVVPNNGNGYPKDGVNPKLPKLNMFSVVRFIMDNCESVDDAVDKLSKRNIWCPEIHGYEIHLMIADAEKTVVVECIDGKLAFMYDNEENDFGWSEKHALMTNFHLTGTQIQNGEMQRADETYTSSPSNIEALGCGVERYNCVLNGINSVTDKDSATALIESVMYDRAYDISGDMWYTEFVGSPKDAEHTGLVYVYSSPSDYDYVMNVVSEAFKNRTREDYYDDDKVSTWTTTHTSVMDIENRTLYLKIDNGESAEYEYKINA